VGEWRIEQLGRADVREDIDCGKPSLNEFLYVLVSQYEKTGVSVVFSKKPAVSVVFSGEKTTDTGFFPGGKDN